MWSSLGTRTRRWRHGISTVTKSRGTRQGRNRGETFVVDLSDLMTNVLVDRANDGGLTGLALSVIRSQSVASVLCIIVSERNSLTPTSTPAQHERSGGKPGPKMTREQLEHPAGQESAVRGDEEARSWTWEGMGNVRAALLRLLLNARRRHDLRERRR